MNKVENVSVLSANVEARSSADEDRLREVEESRCWMMESLRKAAEEEKDNGRD